MAAAPKKRRTQYSVEQRLKILDHADEHGIRAAGRHYDVGESSIRAWKQKREVLMVQGDRKGTRVGTTGRPCASENLEIELSAYIQNQRDQRIRVSRRELMTKAAAYEIPGFKASSGWLRRFLERNGFAIRRKTTQGQKDPPHMTSKLVSFVKHVRRCRNSMNLAPKDIYAMDETAVWLDSPGATTIERKGAQSVSLKSTGHEKLNITVALTVRGDGTKAPPYIVFKGAVRDTARLGHEYRHQAFISTTPNGWMNETTSKDFIDRTLGLGFKRRLIIWDSFRGHISEGTKGHLRAKKVAAAVIPGGCTSRIQIADVIFNKTFKAKITDLYTSWIADESAHTFTAAGNLRAPSRELAVKWVIQAWSEVPEEMIVRGLKSCAITNAVDGSEDHLIHCFKPGQPNSSGLEALKEDNADPAVESDDDDDEETAEAEDDDEETVEAGDDEDVIVDGEVDMVIE